MPITQLTKISDLVEHLRESNVPHQVGNNVVDLPINAGVVNGVLYIRWEVGLPYVQLIFPFLFEIPEARVREVESAICHANGVIALPGFGYEYDRKFIYMRLCVPMYEEGMLAASFQKQVFGVVNNVKDFALAFQEVVRGNQGAEIMALAVKFKTGPQAPISKA